MADFIQFLFIIFPFILAIFLLVAKRWKADTVGILVWILIGGIAIVLNTPIDSVAIISIAGIIDSFKITLMVGASIFMITYMAKCGALARVIVFIKTLKGSHPAWQIMFLNLGVGCLLVTIGATPVSILPPILMALGFPPVVSVALPAIGYDPLTTYALLAIPAVVFTSEMNALANNGILTTAAPTLQEVGLTFSLYMPIISTGIALGMIYIAGGRKMLKDPSSLIIALITGITAGVSAILANFFGLVTLTGIFAGIGILCVLGIFAKIQGYPIIDRSILTEEDLEIEKTMSLAKAASPWILLVFFAFLTNVIPPIFQLLFSELTFPILVGHFTVKTRFLWQAYTWVIVSTLLSFSILPSNKNILYETMKLFKKRALRPMLSAASFFAVAWIMNQSSPTDPSFNMIYILSEFTSTNFGFIFPILVPFIGFFGGFVSGSETSSIVMFTKYHVQTSNTLGLDPITMGTANGVGGGLASVITPAKVQNAAATIDKIGIEGRVIKKTIIIALLMIMTLAILTGLWAYSFPTIDLELILIIIGFYIVFLILAFASSYFIKQKSHPRR
ncbi:MAG: L-lactate permease [Candidatus Hodarchaeales archaeon]